MAAGAGVINSVFGAEPLTVPALRAKRTQYRSSLATRIAFMPHNANAPLAVNNADVTRTYTVVFHLFKDINLGGQTLNDYEPCAREVLLTLLHGFCLRTGRAHPVKSAFPLVDVKGNVTFEILASQPDVSSPDAADRVPRAVAHRYRFNYFGNRDTIYRAAQDEHNRKIRKPANTQFHFGPDEAVNKWDPHDEAIRLAVGDNHNLLELIHRAQAKNSNHESTAGSVARNKDVLTLPAYSWIKHTRIDSFHDNGIVRYLSIRDTVSSDLGNMTKGRIYDHRPFANVTGNSFSADDIYRKRECDVNSRRIFGYTTAFAYHSIDNDTLASTVNERQLDPDAYGFLNAAVPDTSEEDELVAGTNPHGDAIAQLPDYQRVIVDMTKRHARETDDVAMPTRFPFPGLVYDLHDIVMCPEVFVLVQFPLTMGYAITPYIMEHGQEKVVMSTLLQQLAAVAKLEKLETEEYSHGLGNYDYEDLLHDAEELSDGIGWLNDKGRDLAKEQQEVVEHALRELNGLAAGKDHPLLFNSAYGRYQRSTHAAMYMDDFLWVINHRPGTAATAADGDESIMYIYARMSHAIRKERRAAHGLDTNIIEKFGRVRALTGHTLKVVQEEQKVRDEEQMIARMGRDFAESKVDPIDPTFRQRDDFLEARIDNQCNTVLRRMHAYEKFPALRNDEERTTYLKTFHEQTYTSFRAAVTHVIALLRESQNIPATLASPEFKAYYERVCTAAGIMSILDSNPRYDYDATPFTVCLQQLVDLATDVHKTSPVTLNPALLVFFAALDGFTYEFGRSDPALNIIIAAVTGIGKTFIGKFMAALFPPGVVEFLTNVTKNTFNTDKSYDAMPMVFNEMKAAWLGLQTKEAKEAGSTEEINFLKERMTSFESRVHRTVKDPKTNKHYIDTAKSSHHNVTIGFTNQNMVILDAAVRRRFIILFVPKNLRIPSIDPDLITDVYGKEPAQGVMYERVRAVVALYITVMCCIKACALPKPNTTSLSIWLKLINDIARRRGMTKIFEGTNMHYVIQLTVKIQLYYACWYALLSPDAHEFHSMEGAPERWSADAILQLVGPNMAVAKPALIYALGLMENVITPVYVTRLLKDIVLEGIQIGKGKLRPRRTDVPNAGVVDPKYEYEYLTLTDRNWRALMTTIQKLSKDYELRIEEIELFLRELADQRMPVRKKYDGMVDGDDYITQLYTVPLEPGGNQQFKAPVILEADEQPNKRKGYRLCLYIPYIEQLLKITICGPNVNLEAEAAKLASTNIQQKTYEECTDNFIAEHMAMKAEHSVLMDIVREAMESDVLEKGPIERAGAPVNPVVTRYITPLHPEPVILERAEDRVSGRSQYMTLPMVMLHGTGRQLHMRRINKPMPKIMLQDFGQPTSERNLKRARTGEGMYDERVGIYRSAATVTSRLLDPDYTAAKEMTMALCLPVSPLVRKAYGDVIAMRPNLVLPLGFMPITYFVARHFSHANHAENRFISYPLKNIRTKLENGYKRLQGITSNEISPDHLDIELMSGKGMTIGGITFEAPAVSQAAWDAHRAQMEEAAMDIEAPEFDWYYAPDWAGGGGGDNEEDEEDAMDIS